MIYIWTLYIIYISAYEPEVFFSLPQQLREHIHKSARRTTGHRLDWVPLNLISMQITIQLYWFTVTLKLNHLYSTDSLMADCRLHVYQYA